jgi:hypothetical protein
MAYTSRWGLLAPAKLEKRLEEFDDLCACASIGNI